MKRISIPVPSEPILIGLIFALVLALVTGNFTNALITSAATQANPQAANPAVITGCVGNSNPGDSSLALSGRSITASTLLRVDPSGTCLTSETPITWNVQGPQGVQGIQGPKGDPTYTHTYVVTTTADTVNNGNRLLAIMNTINSIGPSYAISPTLVKLEPGTFDLGSNSITLGSNVNLEGSGQGISSITSTSGSNSSVSNGVVNLVGARSAVRDLTVTNTGVYSYVASIYISGGYTKISDTDMLAGCTSGVGFICEPVVQETYGVYHATNSPTLIQNSVISASGFRSFYSIGIYSVANLEIQNSTVYAVSGGNNIGIKLGGGYDSQNLIEQTNVQAIGGYGQATNIALYVSGINTQVRNSTFVSHGYGSDNIPSTAIYSNSISTTVQSSVMQVNASTNGTPNYAINNLNTLKVGSSVVDGVVNNTGTLKCVASYNGNYDPINDIANCS